MEIFQEWGFDMAMAFTEVGFFGESMIGNPWHLCKLYLMLRVVLFVVKRGAGLENGIAVSFNQSALLMRVLDRIIFVHGIESEV